MTDRTCELTIDGVTVTVPVGASIVAAIVTAGTLCTRRSVTGQRRFALCGMGRCQECRVTVDGRQHVLACRTACAEGMQVLTGAQP
ncbi:2Fe-2S iron-sulfur cluster-binding protein [Pseudoduganella chitinolytica]|uniref:2Fe-2S iron-sulfur cluster-binding protein n=1 Tax=Pseudoduganella chitinolytica TaxID=34070 RepID=A0ABY8B4E1_9BURK|nr:2Fe-2S iron-sulfur cluster-binding protein [Pseudoduganella chitinolytica]WEF30822.1 2Fe-2S iron-sulfur cluster-binding protein [Pseudoduganella chitinolytica]